MSASHTPVGVDLYNCELTGELHCSLRTAQGHGAPAVLVAASPTPTSLPSGRHAKTSASPASVPGSTASDQSCSTKPPESFGRCERPAVDSHQLGLFGRTSEEPCLALTGVTSQQCSTSWPTSGRWTLHGECWMHAGSESPNVAVESSLSLILQDNVPERFTLSPRACRGILARAERRGRALPVELETALRAVS